MPGASRKLVLEILLREVNKELQKFYNLKNSEEKEIFITLYESKKWSIATAIEIIEGASSVQGNYTSEERDFLDSVEKICTFRTENIRELFRFD